MLPRSLPFCVAWAARLRKKQQQQNKEEIKRKHTSTRWLESAVQRQTAGRLLGKKDGEIAARDFHGYVSTRQCCDARKVNAHTQKSSKQAQAKREKDTRWLLEKLQHRIEATGACTQTNTRPSRR
jgi:hypothetical protein